MQAAAAAGGGEAAPRVPKWVRPATHGAQPAARGGHACLAVGNLVIVFGGTSYSGDSKFTYMNDLWALDSDTMKWHKPSCAGRAPGARYAHAACVVGYKVYIFGGKGSSGVLYNDLWCLDVERWAWEHVPSSTAAPPAARCGHSLTAVGDKLAVFGGWDGTRNWFNDFWLFDISTFTWVKPAATGMAPQARHGHVTIYDEVSQRLLVFGGWSNAADGVPQYNNDTRALELHTLAWSRPRLAGDFPSPRYWHAAACVGNVAVCVGGWTGPRDVKEEEEGTATSAGADTISIPYAAGMGAEMPAYEGALITVPFAPHPDCFFLDLDSAEWVQPFVAGKAPGFRHGAGVCTIGAQIFIFGGWENGRAMNDVLLLDMSTLVAESGEGGEGDQQEDDMGDEQER